MSCFVFDQTHFPDPPYTEPVWVGNTIFLSGGDFRPKLTTLVEYNEGDPGWDSYANPWGLTPCRPAELPVTIVVPFFEEPWTTGVEEFYFWIQVYDTGTPGTPGTLSYVPLTGGEGIFVPGENYFVITLDWTGIPDTAHIAIVGFESFLYPEGDYAMTIGEQGPESSPLYWTSFVLTKELET